MRRTWLFLLLSVPTARALLLNEIMANPAGSEYTDEYLELVQEDSLGMDLSGWRLSDGTAEDGLVSWSGGPLWLAPGALALILDSGYAGAYDDRIPPGVLLLTVADGALGSGGLSNSEAEPIALIDPAGHTVDLVWTRPAQEEDRSLERVSEPALCDSCWRPALVMGGTPGSPNSVRIRRWDLSVVALDQWRLRASGREGFQGRIRRRTGWQPCLGDQTLGPYALAPGQELRLDPPALPLEGRNPLVLECLPDDDAGRVLADTLLWRDPVAGALYIEAVQPDGDDWAQVACAGPCPCLLDGLALEGRSFTRDLAGWLGAGGRLLAGQTDPDCAVDQHDARSLSLALTGLLILRGPAGQVLDEAIWPVDNPAAPAPWRRLDPARPGDRFENWLAQPGLSPGCPVMTPSPGPPGSAGWSVNLRVLRKSESLLMVEAPPGLRSWRLELWSLDGRLVHQAATSAGRLFWDGRLDGAWCPSGLYVLRLAGDGREQLQTLALRP